MKIENEFTPYKQALALKELGFDEPCFKYIYIGDTGTNCDHFEETLPSKAKNYNIDSLCISQPTFSQAFRWFREKYGLRYSIFEMEDTNKISGSIKGTSKNNFKHFGFINFYDTDEEAELECLKKLIEIVKEK